LELNHRRYEEEKKAGLQRQKEARKVDNQDEAKQIIEAGANSGNAAKLFLIRHRREDQTMDKVTFNARLQEMPIKDHPHYRPFQCHGYPLDADVFIIGLNPAASELPNWWTFWNTNIGFDFNGFESVYLKRRGKMSSTRKRATCIIEGLGPQLKQGFLIKNQCTTG
jgi:hypothetical protein